MHYIFMSKPGNKFHEEESPCYGNNFNQRIHFAKLLNWHLKIYVVESQIDKDSNVFIYQHSNNSKTIIVLVAVNPD